MFCKLWSPLNDSKTTGSPVGHRILDGMVGTTGRSATTTKYFDVATHISGE